MAKSTLRIAALQPQSASLHALLRRTRAAVRLLEYVHVLETRATDLGEHLSAAPLRQSVTFILPSLQMSASQLPKMKFEPNYAALHFAMKLLHV